MKRKQIIAGNWKMNHSIAATHEFIDDFKDKIKNVSDVEIVLCPPFTSLQSAIDATKNSNIAIGAQNIHWAENGAFTGEISAAMLLEIPVSHVIIGHSERRQYFGETNQTVNARIKAALNSQLLPIVCVGETLEERQAGTTEKIVSEQFNGSLDRLTHDEMNQIVIAYEPVWAIGTGVTATPGQAQEVHEYIRRLISEKYGGEMAESTRIQYGGSVKPNNADTLLSQPDIDGALVGGASLIPDDLVSIIKCAELN